MCSILASKDETYLKVVKEYIVNFKNEGQTLVGIMTFPEEIQKPLPAVVLLHGFTSNKNEDFIVGTGVEMFHHTAKRLSEAGYITLRFDFTGHGESDGDFEDLTISNLISDTLVAIDFIANQKGVNPERIGLLGQSLGGLTAAYVGCRDDRIKSISLWNAPPHPFETFVSLMGWDTVREVFSRDYITFNWENKGQFTLKAEFFNDLIKTSPLVEITKFSGSLLVIGGKTDQYIHPQPQMGDAFILAHRGKNKLVILNTDHSFNIKTRGAKYLDEAIKWTIQWFKDKI
jgi:dipeptidyl aminopeptidase/acylaminoacyl peptidase